MNVGQIKGRTGGGLRGDYGAIVELNKFILVGFKNFQRRIWEAWAKVWGVYG